MQKFVLHDEFYSLKRTQTFIDYVPQRVEFKQECADIFNAAKFDVSFAYFEFEKVLVFHYKQVIIVLAWILLPTGFIWNDRFAVQVERKRYTVCGYCHVFV